MPNWWAEFWWSRTEKTKAAFRRGFAMGFLVALLFVTITEKLLR